MKNRLSFSVLYALLFIIASCQNTKSGKINSSEGKVEIIILNATDFEKKIIYSKKEIIRKIESSPDTTTIYLSTKFCNDMDEIRNLGASFFEMKFYDSNNNLELELGSFSSIASIRSHKKQKINIVYDFKKNSYFPSKLIKIPLL
jgi:hypothetical protein